MTSYDCETRLRIADGERRKALESALRAAAWDGGAQTMGRMLEGLGIPGEPQEPDADAHYVALAAEVLLEGPEKEAAWRAAGRTFLCGCHREGDVVFIQTYGAVPDGFFETLARLAKGAEWLGTTIDEDEDE